MSERTSGIRAVLSQPAVYELAQRAIGSVRVRDTFAETYVQAVAGQKLLDIGCGPGDILGHLPEVDYVGFDVSASYIASAQQRWGHRGRFFIGTVSAAQLDKVGRDFDRVTAKGVLHHISDADADALFGLAALAVRSDGRVVTIDPCFHEGQAWVARSLAARDRGQAVREPDQYVEFARRHFEHVDVELHTDLLRVPYSHAVVVAQGPRR